MSGEQLELALIAAGGAFATLVGMGVLDLGMSERRKRLMRWAGAVALVVGGLLLASTYVP
jgi:hypothetical protein